MRLGISVARPNLVSIGTCFGKFNKSGKFKLHITALDHLAQYAKYKVRRVDFLIFTFIPNQTSRYVAAGLDKTQWRDAFPLRKPRIESTPRANHRRHTGTPGSCRLQYE